MQNRRIFKMGRPINKKFFGPDGAGFQLLGLADFGAGAVPCYIVRQRSNRKFEVADAAAPSTTLVCKLVDGAPAAPGEMSISINAGTDYVRKVTAHRAYGFLADSLYYWSDITSAEAAVDDAITADVGFDDDDLAGNVIDDEPAP